MAGTAIGLDYKGALALAPKECARDALTFLLRQAEAGLLAGFRKAEEN